MKCWSSPVALLADVLMAVVVGSIFVVLMAILGVLQ